MKLLNIHVICYNLNIDSDYITICDESGTPIEEIKKSRFLWILGNEKERISIDRMQRFKQGRKKELTVERITTDKWFYRDTAIIAGDWICTKFNVEDSICIIGKIVKFQYSESSTKKEKRFTYKYLIVGLNKDIEVRVSPCYIIDKKRKIKSCPLKFVNVNQYACSVKKNAIDFSKKNVNSDIFQLLKKCIT